MVLKFESTLVRLRLLSKLDRSDAKRVELLLGLCAVERLRIATARASVYWRTHDSYTSVSASASAVGSPVARARCGLVVAEALRLDFDPTVLTATLSLPIHTASRIKICALLGRLELVQVVVRSDH